MTEEQPENRKMAMAELIRPAVEDMLGQIDRRTEAALRPLITQIEDLQRQVAELRGDPPLATTSDREDGDPAL